MLARVAWRLSNARPWIESVHGMWTPPGCGLACMDHPPGRGGRPYASPTDHQQFHQRITGRWFRIGNLLRSKCTLRP